ncbi:DNase I-like protein, partial [Clavulina sp. PMI_390]
LLHRNKIAIAALQETHSTQKQIDGLNKDHSSWEIHHTSSPGRERRKAGIALVINKEKLPMKGIKIREIIPGRAIWARIPWRKGIRIKILAVYAPNDPEENAAFWSEIQDALKCPGNGTVTPVDFIVGDTNMVEDPRDRWPQRADETQAMAFQELKNAYRLQDGWRRFYPYPDRQPSFFQSEEQGGSMSRIDRIYCTEEMYNRSTEWKIFDPLIAKLDHHIAAVWLKDYKTPTQGPGRWSMPLSLLDDPKFIKAVDKAGKSLQTKMEFAQQARSDESNPQKVMQTFLSWIKEISHTFSGERSGRIMTLIGKLQEDL